MNLKQIIITFITLITLIGIGWYCYRKFKPSIPNSTNEPINTIEENDDSIQKTETTSTEKSTKVETTKIEEKEQTKKMISQLKFNEIKTYIFSQYNDDTLPADLSPIEKTKIEELKSSFQTVFQEKQTKIEKQQKVIDDHNKNLSEIATKLKKPNISRTEIRTLEIDRETINKKLGRVVKYKQDLESNFNKSCIEDDGLSLIVELNKLYEIN
jgi:F0F1-type ATP synthase membrane subunit b/b'